MIVCVDAVQYLTGTAILLLLFLLLTLVYGYKLMFTILAQVPFPFCGAGSHFWALGR
jgi:K+-transporting ATPase c subunit